MLERIGPYRVEGEIGRGGMGVVYRAVDERLDRVVAIKALPDELAGDAFRLERFEREAKTLAALNHSNLAGIHGVEELDGKKYLILEYVGGETLADVLERGPVALHDAVEWCAQIALGLEAAHEAGVIHRDLKPANVKVTEDGEVKVLDFGLAHTGDGQSSSSMSQMPTEGGFTNSPTIPGAILGTAAYMSPEQARGRKIDKRTDIWSFGVLLYELLVGASPFIGETAGDSIGAVLHKDVDLERIPEATPVHVRRVLSRCLERDKAERYRDIGDVRIELLWRGEGREFSQAAEVGRRATSSPVLVAVAAAVSAAAVGAAWWGSVALRPEETGPIRKLDLVTAGVDEQMLASRPMIAPGGDRVAFIRDDSIHLRLLSEFESRPIPGSEGAERLCWSPDGKWLAFSTAEGIQKIPSTGGGATKISDLDVNFRFAWTADDRIVVSNSANNDDEIFEISARGGTPRVLLDGDDETIDYHSVTVVPGTDVLLYLRHRRDGRTPIEAWDGERSEVLVDLDDMYMATFAWSPTGHILFSRGMGETDLWAVPFSVERMQVTGDPFLVMEEARSPSVSDNGTLAVLRGGSVFGGELVWVLPGGEIETIADVGEVARDPLVSPDGSRVAFARGRSPQEADLWVRDLDRGVDTRIADTNSFVMPVAWSPDGDEIAVMTFDIRSRENAQKTQFFATDGTGSTREFFVGLLPAISSDWTLAISATDPMQPATTFSTVRLDDYSVTGEIVSTSKSWLFVGLDPTDSLVIYQSGDSGDQQIYCTRFPSGEGRWQVSSDGGTNPTWAPDGSAVYYQADGSLFRVRVTREPELRFGVPEQMFDLGVLGPNFQGRLSSAPDGERFISVRSGVVDEDREPQSISVIQNWYEEFRDDSE